MKDTSKNVVERLFKKKECEFKQGYCLSVYGWRAKYLEKKHITQFKAMSKIYFELLFLYVIWCIWIPHVLGDLNFASIGNWGYESSTRKSVVNKLKEFGRKGKLTFLISPGSNFAGGIQALNDSAWKIFYENAFADDEQFSLKIPFFPVLGAEDWTGNYTAEILRTNYDYSTTRDSCSYPKWTLPNWWYHYITHFSASSGPSFVKTGHKDIGVAFVFIDTWVLSSSFPFSNVTSRAWNDLENTLSNAARVVDYIIVVGDRGIYSSGISKGDAYLRYHLDSLLEKYEVDAYISGYDFDMEIIRKRNTSYINCGTGSMGLSGTGPFKVDGLYFTTKPGFCLHTLAADGLHTKFVDGITGQILFTYSQEPIHRQSKVEFTATETFGYYASLPEVKFFPIPLIGRNGIGRETFVRIVGTIGLMIFAFFMTLVFFVLAAKATK